MAFSLKKWITGQMESARLNDYNDNMTAIEGAIDTLQTNASLLDFSTKISDAYAWAEAEPKRLKTGITETSATNIPGDQFKYASAVCLYRYGLARVVLISTDGKIAIGVKKDGSSWRPWVIHG